MPVLVKDDALFHACSGKVHVVLSACSSMRSAHTGMVAARLLIKNRSGMGTAHTGTVLIILDTYYGMGSARSSSRTVTSLVLPVLDRVLPILLSSLILEYRDITLILLYLRTHV